MEPFERKAYSQYGSSMGRATVTPLEGRVHLKRVHLDSGGYDKGGAYWGIGAPLWCAYNDEGETFLRAGHREQAKTKLLQDHPAVRFYR